MKLLVCALIFVATFMLILYPLADRRWANGLRARSRPATAMAPASVPVRVRDVPCPPVGKATGRYDVTLSEACAITCATQADYASSDVQVQPGAKVGDLTECPVCGVVFTVEEDLPRVRNGGDEYVACCETCAKKFRRGPRLFVRE